MTKKLIEAKANLESGIAKSLVQAPLDIEEIAEIDKVNTVELVSDHGLDSAMAEVVLAHVTMEKSRLANQQLMTRDQLEESIRKSIRRSFRKISKNL